MQSLEKQTGSWDSVLLENLTEDTFISNLHQRYKRDHIYTYIGTILISINPYKPLLLYSPDLVRTYATKGLFKLPPHIYAVSNSAYQWLENYNEDQCIIISGESGSGKTETARMCVHFLTQVSEIRRQKAKLSRQGSTNSLSGVHVASQSNSRNATPKHTASTSTAINSTPYTNLSEKMGCLVIKTGSLKKCSREKTVDFDFSYNSSSTENLVASPNLNKCYKLHNLGISSTSLQQSSPIKNTCSKHNNTISHNSKLKFENSSSSSTSSTTGPQSRPTSLLKCATCNNHHSHSYEITRDKLPSTKSNKKLVKYSTIECDCDYGKKISNQQKRSTVVAAAPSSIAIDRTTPAVKKILPCKSPINKNKSVGTTSVLFKKDPSNEEHLLVLRMKERIAKAEVILEALGNAATIRNSNSSRFGKFFDIEFDFKGDPIGGHIIHYMLEKSRVTQTKFGERNFHIFYQLLCGADIQFLKSLKLQRNINKYELLKNGSSTEDDKENYVFTKNSLEILGFTHEEILSFFKIVAVIIKLGNLNFIPTTNIDGTESCTSSNEYELHEISLLLNLDYQILINCLTRGNGNWNQLDTGPELDAATASRTKNTLCRTLYGRLFTWAVNRINGSLKIMDSQHNIRKRNLGILDFYGFEILENNSFEQLAINYCNERLHQNFLQNVLKFHQELYTRDGLEWSRIDYFDNETICELIDKSNYGILSLLDEPQVTCDATFFTRIYQCCSGHPNFVGQDRSSRDTRCFQIRHYAGQVTYAVDNFVEKNLDILPRNISFGLYQSKLTIVQTLFPEGNPKRGTKKPTSVGSNLRKSLSTLLSTVKNRRNHYIFCVKPNEMRKQRYFELALVQHQIRYMNLMPVVNLWRAGHYFQLGHQKFYSRYKLLSHLTWPHFVNGTVVEAIAIIIRSIPLPIAEFTIGLSNVFIRSPRTVFELEELREIRLDVLATYIQKTFRCYSLRKLFLKMKRSQIIISSAWKTWRECRFGIPFTGRRHMWGLYRAAREEYRIQKYRKQVEWAEGVIQRQYVQWKRRQFLFTLPLRLPPDSMSPLCFEWPAASRYLTETSQLLRNIYHRWRCYKYRKSFDQTARNRMREKVTASIIFKDRKASYVKSVSHPFLGDYVRLRQNVQWKKISVENNDQYVVFADIINKITRSSGKFVPILLVLSTSSMLLLDQRTLQVKYRVPATEIYRLSLSPYLDDIAVFHVKASELGKKKGDFVFQTGHVIEIVTKLFLVVQNATSKPPEVHISTEFEANFGQQTVLFTFKCGGLAEVQHGQPRITRKSNRMEIIV